MREPRTQEKQQFQDENFETLRFWFEYISTFFLWIMISLFWFLLLVCDRKIGFGFFFLRFNKIPFVRFLLCVVLKQRRWIPNWRVKLMAYKVIRQCYDFDTSWNATHSTHRFVYTLWVMRFTNTATAYLHERLWVCVWWNEKRTSLHMNGPFAIHLVVCCGAYEASKCCPMHCCRSFSKWIQVGKHVCGLSIEMSMRNAFGCIDRIWS